ncbi:MAG: ABC transporter transmembrane domain-containing protein [Pseudomonadota bacterium]
MGWVKYHSPKADMLKPEGFRQHVVALVISTLAIGILSLALPVMTLQIYDRILPNPGGGTLFILICGVCIAIGLEALLRLCRSYLIGRSGATYEHLMACKVMGKTLGADLSKVTKLGVGEKLHRMGSVSKLKDFYNGYALSTLVELSFVPLFFGFIIFISKPLAIVPATILSIFLFVAIHKGQRLRAALEQRERVDDDRFNFLIESLEGVHTVKAFALERFFERRYEKLEEASTLENYNVTKETSSTFNHGAVFSHLMVVSVISVGAYFVLNGALTSGGLIAVLLLSGRMMPPVQKALALWMRYQDYLLARHHVTEICTVPQEKLEARTSSINLIPDGQLTLSDVSFQYAGSDHAIFSQVNLEMQRGDTVLISGGHGSGKTTLLRLIAGVYRPVTGTVHIDGENMNSYTAHDLSRHVGYVPAQPLIFRGTIRDNITCFGLTQQEQAREVTTLLQVDKDVAKLPNGFDTFLTGSHTDNIPPGLKQRISIARALAAKPRLILFDNADRSLDKDGYALIYSLLARLKGKASLILISDDHNICGLADQHYELKDGRFNTASKISNGGGIRPYKELRL